MKEPTVLIPVICHARTWNADFREREQSREYLGAAGSDGQVIRQPEARSENGPLSGGNLPLYSVLCHATESSEAVRPA